MSSPSASATGARPKRSAGAMRIIDEAEALFAEHGVDGVSMRQIALAAGQLNPAAVQYHFGTKHDLVAAIIAARLPGIDARRRAKLDAAREAEGISVRALVEILFMPVFEEVDRNGRRTYARFLSQLHRANTITEAWRPSGDSAEATNAATDALRALLPHVPAQIFYRRMLLAAGLAFDAIARDEALSAGEGEQSLPIALDMIVAAIQAPPSPATLGRS